jgi:hypothetical protein
MIRTKQIFSILLSTMLILAVTSIAMIDLTNAQLTPNVYVNPVTGTGDPGAHYFVDIEVVDAEMITGWEVKLGYEGLVLDLQGVTEGTFLSAVGDTDFNVEITPFGYVQIGCTLTEDASADGHGTLATLDFLVMPNAPGVSALMLFDTLLYDTALAEVTHTTVDGMFTATLVPIFDWDPVWPIAGEV